MKKLTSVLVILMLVPLSFGQEDTTETPEGEDEAGGIGPEDGFLHAFDIIADNIAEFLSRIGGEEMHANTVRRIVAERRAEHLRLLRLKQEGEITPQEFSDMVNSLNKQIQKKEEALTKSEERIAKKENAKSKPTETLEQKGTEKGKSAGKGKK